MPPLADHFGVEVEDFSIADLGDDETVRTLRDAFDAGVVLIRGLSLSDEEHNELVEALGELHRFPWGETFEYMSNVMDDTPSIAGTRRLLFHNDGAYGEHVAPGTCLYALDVSATSPPTAFANTVHAYEQLPSDIRKAIDGLHGYNTFNVTAAIDDEHPSRYRIADHPEPAAGVQLKSAVHPAVITVPHTGHKALFVSEFNTSHFVELGPDSKEGDELLQQGLAGSGEVVGGQGAVGGAEQPLAVQVLLALDRSSVDPEQTCVGAAQVTTQPRLALERADELVAPPVGPRMGAGHQLLEVHDQAAADSLVAVGLFGVVADHEALGPRALVAVTVATGCDRDLLDPQVPATVRYRPAGPVGGRLGVGVAELLGVDVVPTTAGQVGAVRGGGEAAVGDPDHPVQVPAGQVVLHGPDDRGVGGVTGELPAPHRDTVTGDGHRDHDLRQVGAVASPSVGAAGQGPSRDPRWKSRTNRPITHARSTTKIIKRSQGLSRVEAVDPG